MQTASTGYHVLTYSSSGVASVSPTCTRHGQLRFCHVQQHPKTCFDKEVEKSIKAELVKAAPNSSLAKHKSRQRKPAAAVDSDANVTCFFTTVFAHDRVNASLREFSTFQFFEAVNEATTVKLKRFSLANLTPKESSTNKRCV